MSSSVTSGSSVSRTSSGRSASIKPEPTGCRPRFHRFGAMPRLHRRPRPLFVHRCGGDLRCSLSRRPCWLLAVAGAVFLVGRDSPSGLAGVSANAVGIIDPTSNAIVAEVPVGIRPGPIAAGDGSVWVGNLDDRTLTRIDPGQRSAVATVSLDDRTPTGLAVGAGAVWVAHGMRGQASRVDEQFNRLTNTIDVASALVHAPAAWPSGRALSGSCSATPRSHGSSQRRLECPHRLSRVRCPPRSWSGAAPSGLPTPETPLFSVSTRQRSRRAQCGRAASAGGRRLSHSARERSGLRTRPTIP